MKPLLTSIFSTVLLFLLLGRLLLQPAAAQAPVNWKNVKVLIYTKNGKGYVHDNIPNAVSCLQKLGQQHGFKVEVSDTPSVFTENNLKQYALLIFPSTNNDVFRTDEQRLAFRRYIEAGGGFVGIHSVVGTERNWKWFKTMVGGSFVWHPQFQPYDIRVIDPKHPSVRGLPLVWKKSDECYFVKEMYPGIKVVLAHDLTTISTEDSLKMKNFAGPFTDLYPAAWYHSFDGGYAWITALGHDKGEYNDQVFTRHIFQGIEFVAGQVGKADSRKAYATSRDEPIR